MEFQEFRKIARLNRPCVITEKIDGTCGLIAIGEISNQIDHDFCIASNHTAEHGTLGLFAGSKSRWLLPTKDKDNFGFAAWAQDNAGELFNLGPGYHYGEYWGYGIQRGYDQTERHFSLFNTSWWAQYFASNDADGPRLCPPCCRVVPVLYSGQFSTVRIARELAGLGLCGSVAAPNYMNPEGVIVYHCAMNQYAKVTLESDGERKGLHKMEAEKVRPPKIKKDRRMQLPSFVHYEGVERRKQK